VELTVRWVRPVLAVSAVALIVGALALTLSGPSGVVIPAGGLDNSGHPARWHLCRLPLGRSVSSEASSWSGEVEGCAPGIDGLVRAHAIRLHVRPGRYLLNMGSPTCWSRTQVTVSAHRFVTPKRGESMSCSIQ
jgi:hypothetical protein